MKQKDFFTSGQIKSIPVLRTSAKALPSSVENQYNKERGEKRKEEWKGYLQHGRWNPIGFHQTLEHLHIAFITLIILLYENT